MAIDLVDTPGQSPYFADDTRQWVETNRKNGLIKPQVLLRYATDTSYISNKSAVLYADTPRHDAKTRAMMNLALPGQRIPGLLNWTVTEQLDQVTQTASFEATNCLPLSDITTTLTSSLSKDPHSTTITASYVANSQFVVEKVSGNNNVENSVDNNGYHFREDNVKYRTFANQTFTVADASAFPDPAVPDDADNDVSLSGWSTSASGSGSYFLLIDQEVVRVVQKSGSTFHIPPGGRAINGIKQAHSSGAVVTLLGYGKGSGKWCAMGYLNIDDFRPQKALLRPGTCLVSYEGYGDITGPLTHDYSRASNYCFTGYWFVSAIEPSIDETGVPKVKVDLKSAGYMFEQQKISGDIVRRIKNQFGQWDLAERDGRIIWGRPDHFRSIPSDWKDFHSWDPTLPGSYPLAIKTEFAQHKEFAQHMQETNLGRDCLICRAEHADWIKQYQGGGVNAFKENRVIGKHIYKQSIRVLSGKAGPIMTFIRLMGTLAASAWDHPAYGTELAQSFTKIPNDLFDNIRNVKTGLVFNGQVNAINPSSDAQYDWFTPTYTDTEVISKRDELMSPFESTYDNAPFSQPMLDLADLNGNTFWVNRHGYPVFKPRNFSMRPAGHGYKDLDGSVAYTRENSEWFLSYGGSISQYSNNLTVDQAVTQAWVTGTTVFDDTVTVLTGGTGYKGVKRVIYSALGGNREGLSLTSGVQQVQTLSLDNVVLGLDWNTEAGWGLKYVDENGDLVMQVKPPIYDGTPTLQKGSEGTGVKWVQRTINFFMVREYMDPWQYKSEWILGGIPADGKYQDKTVAAVKALQTFLGVTSDGIYGKATGDAAHQWVADNEHHVKYDINWYVQNNKDTAWEYYVAAVTGMPVTQKRVKKGGDPAQDYVPDEKSLNEQQAIYAKSQAKTLINSGNRLVDDSLNKATARSIQTVFADPRIQPGDTIWCEIPGFLGSRDVNGDNKPPYTNGIYVTNLTRTLDLMGGGSYTATYSGYRYRGDFGASGTINGINGGYDFV